MLEEVIYSLISFPDGSQFWGPLQYYVYVHLITTGPIALLWSFYNLGRSVGRR